MDVQLVIRPALQLIMTSFDTATTPKASLSLELIGRGSFGDVYKGIDKELNKVVAIKVIDLEEAEDEIEDIQKCRSPYITKYYGSYPHETKLWLIMEHMAGGSVADLIQSGPPMDEMAIGCILRDLLHAVEYLHNEGKIHRDIKAANILLTENGDVKVADFGVSAQLTRTISRRKSSSISFENTSTSGAVFRGQHDDGGSPQTPRSRRGFQERFSEAPIEDSSTNLAEAKAAIQGGSKRVNPPERYGIPQVNKDMHNIRKKDNTTSGSDLSRNSREFFDAPRGFSKLSYSDDEDNLVSSAADASIPFKALLYPSVKEAFADDPEGPIVHSVISALATMEHVKPGSCEIIISKMLHRLESSKEASLKDLQDLAVCIFKGKLGTGQSSNPVPGSDEWKKQQGKDFSPNPNLSPLARFLLSRWQGHVSRDLSSE